MGGPDVIAGPLSNPVASASATPLTESRLNPASFAAVRPNDRTVAPANTGMNMNSLPSWLTNMFQPSGNVSRAPSLASTPTTLASIAGIGPDASSAQSTLEGFRLPDIIAALTGRIPGSIQGGAAYVPPAPGPVASGNRPPGQQPIQLLGPNGVQNNPAPGGFNNYGMTKPEGYADMDSKYGYMKDTDLHEALNGGDHRVDDYVAYRLGPYGYMKMKKEADRLRNNVNQGGTGGSDASGNGGDTGGGGFSF